MNGAIGNNNCLIMKRAFYLIVLAALAVSSCSKEIAFEEQNEVKAAGSITLTATMPDFEVTKAYVDGADGVFHWEGGEVIDVVYSKAGSADKKYQFSCTNATKGEFTNDEEIDEGYSIKTSGTVAYFPHGYNGTPSNQTFNDGIEEAQTHFQMHATYSDGQLAFVHDNALIKVQINGVPKFAKRLVVGGTNVKLSLASTTDLVAYIPVAPADGARLVVSVMDRTEDGNAIILKQTHNAVNIESATIYPLPVLNVGTVITLNDAASKSKSRIKVWKIDDTSKNYIFTDANSYPGKRNTTTTGEYYVVLNTYDAPWATEGTSVGVSYDNNDDDATACTTQIYLRDIDFTTLDSGALKAEYRIFPHGTTSANHLFATYATGTYSLPDNVVIHVSKADGLEGWSTIYAYIQDNDSSADVTSDWPGNTLSDNAISIPRAKILGKHVTLQLHQNTGNSWDLTMPIDIDCKSTPNSHLSDIYIRVENSCYEPSGVNKRNYTWTSTTYANEILEYPLGADPGTSFTCPATLDMTKYVSVPVGYADKTLHLSFNNSGTLVTDWGNVTINRDFDYGF